MENNKNWKGRTIRVDDETFAEIQKIKKHTGLTYIQIVKQAIDKF